MRYTHLIFDFDHMIFDTDASEAQAFAYALTAHGVPAPEPLLEKYQVINQSLWRQVEKGTITPNDVKGQRFADLAVEAGLTYDAEAVSESYTEGLAQFGELYEGAGELIDQLTGTHSLSMVTNGLGPVQRGRLDRIGLSGIFAPLVISGEVGTSKPRAEIYQTIFDAHPDVARSRFLMIGDSLTSDMQGGINAGIDTCWYNPHRLDSGDRNITHQIHQLRDLLPVVSSPRSA